jgi:hypothetical protein
MPNMLRKPTVALVVVVAAGLAAGVAWATIPDGSGTIHACYTPSDKSLRVIGSGSCAKGEAALSWSQNAIQGSQGPQGPQGAQGDTGPQGSPGIVRVTAVADEGFEDPVIGGFFKELTCPSGTKALGGYYEFQNTIGTNPPQDQVESFPLGVDSWGFAVNANSTYKGLVAFLVLECVNTN